MTKLNYPVSGVYSKVDDDLNNASVYLQRAYNNCNFSVPSDFKYLSFCRGLDSQINTYRNELDKIIVILKYVDNNFDNLEDDLQFNCTDIPKIKERDRLII